MTIQITATLGYGTLGYGAAPLPPPCAVHVNRGPARCDTLVVTRSVIRHHRGVTRHLRVCP